MDSVAHVNSHTGSLAEAHIALQNNSASTQSYLIKRAQVGTTGLVDSNYFCWDLCYPTWVNQSQGYVDINAGAVPMILAAMPMCETPPPTARIRFGTRLKM